MHEIEVKYGKSKRSPFNVALMYYASVNCASVNYASVNYASVNYASVNSLCMR